MAIVIVQYKCTFRFLLKAAGFCSSRLRGRFAFAGKEPSSTFAGVSITMESFGTNLIGLELMRRFAKFLRDSCSRGPASFQEVVKNMFCGVLLEFQKGKLVVRDALQT